MEIFFTKNWLTSHIEREDENESSSSILEKPKIENVNINNDNRTILVRPIFSGRTYLLLKNFSRLRDQDKKIITKSPSKH